MVGRPKVRIAVAGVFAVSLAEAVRVAMEWAAATIANAAIRFIVLKGAIPVWRQPSPVTVVVRETQSGDWMGA